MTNTILKNEILSEEQLDTVNGGTVGEFNELISAIVKNPFFNALGKIAGHVPFGNEHLIEDVTKELDNMGIKASIDLGWHGTGINSKNNKYTDKYSGESLTHAQVLKKIENYAG